MLMSSFTSSIADNEFRLVVPAEVRSRDYGAMMAGPLRPFTPTAWMISAALALFMAVSLRIIERRPSQQEEEERGLVDRVARVLGITGTEGNTAAPVAQKAVNDAGK